MTEYRSICRQELDRALFAGFVRRQDVTRCWRKADGAWVIRDVPFVDDWNETDYAALVDCLRRTLAQGGQKLYISAHSAVESQAFYRKMGCVEAEEYDPAHTAAEPCDCQLEYLLTDQT